MLNTRERPTLDEALERELRPLSLDELLDLVSDGAQLLDTREPVEFAGAHVRGSVNVGLGGSFATWSGTILDHEKPIVLVADPAFVVARWDRTLDAAITSISALAAGAIALLTMPRFRESGRLSRAASRSSRR